MNESPLFSIWDHSQAADPRRLIFSCSTTPPVNEGAFPAMSCPACLRTLLHYPQSCTRNDDDVPGAGTTDRKPVGGAAIPLFDLSELFLVGRFLWARRTALPGPWSQERMYAGDLSWPLPGCVFSFGLL